MVEIRAFGPLELAGGGKTLGARDLGGVKPRQVLSILIAQRGRVVTKDRIADLLWGDSPPKNVSATLETYVSKLRRALESVGGDRAIATEPGGYRLEMTELDLDLDRFDRACRAGGRAELAAALALVRGEIFEEETYATWAIRLRDEYRGKHLRALLAAAEAANTAGDHDAALARGTELLAADRTHELGYRVVLAALAALGRADEVVRVFERCRAALREELGVKPSAGLVAHFESLRTGHAPVVTKPAAPSAPRVLPFVGRDTELAQLARAVESSLAGPTTLQLVEAPPGHGKTRLLDELARRTTATIARASCSPIDRELVFAPIAALVRKLGVTDRERYPGLGEIVPELGTSGLPPETARTHALESFVQIITERAPIVVMIDDLQWADPSTVAAISYLARRASRGVAIIGCARAKGLAADHPLRQSQRIELAPLSRDQLAPFGERLYDRTGGNPLFVVELLRAGDTVPDTLRELLLERSSAAGERGHRALAVASVLGRNFAPAALAQLLDESVDDVLEQLDALRAHGLLAESQARDRFEFCHDLVREALYDSLSSPRRRRLHERAAAGLEAAGAPPGEVAHHAEAAGSVELAVRASLRAAEQARAAWANLEAVAHLDRALRLATLHPDVLEPAAVDAARIALARALVTVGRHADAETLLGSARADAESRGDERVLFEIFDVLAFARQRGASAPTDSLIHARAALAIAERLGDQELLSRAHQLVGSPLTSIGQLAEALEHNHAAIEIAERAGKPPRAYPIGRVALTLHLQGNDRESLAWGVRAEDAALAQHDEESLIMARWVRALSCMALGRYGEATRALDAIRDVGRGEEVFWHARVPNTWGALYSDLCLHERALACDQQSLESARKQRGGAVREAELHSLLNIAANQLALGQLEAARKMIEDVRRQVTTVEYARFRWLARMHAIAAELAAAQGDREGALQAADSCLALAEKYGQVRYEVRGKLARAIALGDSAAARTLARSAAAQAETAGWLGLVWRAQSVAGDLGQARKTVLKCAEGLDEPLRSEFLAAVPVSA